MAILAPRGIICANSRSSNSTKDFFSGIKHLSKVTPAQSLDRQNTTLNRLDFIDRDALHPTTPVASTGETPARRRLPHTPHPC
ncbi:hypothetical protein [Chroococcidiopsis sp. SAG 2025]|uniref:hypothetical protein n=1 Tax=Chroococcidiopsis sp. SAG 2025 TaxID=171389 RepID=UPI002936E0BE|nr:hypothetical protein [Chroococcidiopsis sp. SAG 2025]